MPHLIIPLDSLTSQACRRPRGNVHRHELEARLPASLAANRVICDRDCLFRQTSVGIDFAYSSLQRGSL